MHASVTLVLGEGEKRIGSLELTVQQIQQIGELWVLEKVKKESK